MSHKRFAYNVRLTSSPGSLKTYAYLLVEAENVTLERLEVP